MQVGGQPGQVAEAGREPAEGDGELDGGQCLDDAPATRPAGELGDLGEVRPVEHHAAARRWPRPRRPRAAPAAAAAAARVGVGRRPVEDDEHRARGRHQIALAGQRRGLQGRPDGRDGGEIGDLDQQRPVAARQHRSDTVPRHRAMIVAALAATTGQGQDVARGATATRARWGVSIAERFEAALGQVTDPALAGPELLPVRLARACRPNARGRRRGSQPGRRRAQQRIRSGPAPTAAPIAERLQFTVGDGPCMTAQETRHARVRRRGRLRRRWPVFTELLFGADARSAPSSRCRCSPPWPAPAPSTSTSRTRPQVPALDVFEAIAVGELVTSALSDAAVWSELDAGRRARRGCTGPAPQRRAAVWEAMGKLSVDLEIERPGRPGPDARARLRPGPTVDDVAEELLGGHAAVRGTCEPAAG